MSDIRYNQWLHNSGTGGVSQDAGGNIGIGTTAPLIPVGAGNTTILNVGVVTCNSINVTGNVSVGGTLTYEDVTNIDSVGIITARSGIYLDRFIYHLGDLNTSFGFPNDATDTFTVNTSSLERLRITSDGDVGINVTPTSGTKLQIGTPNSTTGVLRAHPDYFSIDSGYANGGSTGGVVGSATTAALIFGGDSNTGLYHSASDTLNFTTGGTERLRIHADGEVEIKEAAAGQTVLSCTAAYASSSTVDIQTWARSDGAVKASMKYSHGTNTMNFGTTTNHPLIFQVNNTEKLRIASNGQIKFATNNSSTDYLLYGTNPRLWLKCPDGINGLRIDSNTTPLEIRTTDANGRSIGVGGAPNFDMSLSGDYSLSANGYDSSPKIFLNATRHNGSSTVTSFQTAIQAVATSNTNNTGYLGLGASASPDDLVIKTDAKIGMQITDPKSNLHVYGPGDIRLGGQYGGHASIMQQVEYSSGYTGVHWMFETNNQMSWSFDGVMIVHGAGGSSYGSEVTHIKIVYSRENGALNSGDTWRNGSSDYNIETLGHGQVGLNPSAGSFSYTEQTNPDGTGSTRSLLKLSWSASGQGVGVWSKLIGNFYWGAASSSGSVEIQDKDGNIKFNSNP